MIKVAANTNLRFAEASAELLTLMANANRLHILSILVEREISVEPLRKLVGLRPPALSQHLAKLRAANVVSFHRKSKMIYYRCDSVAVRKVLVQLEEIFEPEDVELRELSR